MQLTHLTFDNFTIRVTSMNPHIHKQLAHDFYHYLSSPYRQPNLCIEHIERKKRPKFWVPFFITRRSVLFLAPFGTKRVEYFSNCWLNWQWNKGKCHIMGEKLTPVYETIFMLIHSSLCEHENHRGRHHIHATAFSYYQSAFLGLAPSGGGKSTLAMKLLDHAKFKILADDCPWLDSSLTVWPFNDRIAVKEKPKERKLITRIFKRVHYGEKFVLSYESFRDKISRPATLSSVCLLEKSTNGVTEFRPLPKTKLVWPLFKWLVVGYETPQMWELYLKLSPMHFFKMFKSGVCRLSILFLILFKVPAFRWTMGNTLPERLCKSPNKSLGEFVHA